MDRRLPVTFVSGFFGAGKTSLLHYIISEHRGGYLAVLVENPGTLNFDAKALRGLCGAMQRKHDTILEIPEGDDAIQAEWISAQLREFSETGRYERVLVELGGMTDASWLGRHFGRTSGEPETFSPWANLQQIVCVVDALDWTRQEKQTAPFLDFIREQIAAASLIIFNKCDLIEDREREKGVRSLRSINPHARIVETAYGEVPPDICLSRPLPEEVGPVMMRSREQRVMDRPMPDLASTLYRVHRPFHPQRFWDWFNADHPGLLRVKGLVWLATRNLLVGGVSRTRWQNGCGAAGIWWAALPREEWPEDPEALRCMQEIWREPYGDRRQELVLIGEAGLFPTTMQRQLDACLLTDAEYARPWREWAAWPEPFPAWDLEDG